MTPFVVVDLEFITFKENSNPLYNSKPKTSRQQLAKRDSSYQNKLITDSNRTQTQNWIATYQNTSHTFFKSCQICTIQYPIWQGTALFHQMNLISCQPYIVWHKAVHISEKHGIFGLYTSSTWFVIWHVPIHLHLICVAGRIEKWLERETRDMAGCFRIQEL